MKQLFVYSFLMLLFSGSLTAQKIKVDYITKVPKKILQCGALYTYDSTALKSKKYIMLADFQNLGYISINGKLINLQLQDSKLGDDRMNISTYTGAGGYTVITTIKTTKQSKKIDYEDGILEVSKGKEKIIIKIHGQSACDESKMEGNG